MTRVELAGIERVDELRDLWLELHHHHRAVVGTLPLVKDDELSWQRRRGLYVDRLSSEAGFLVLAIDRDAVVGYALVCIEEGPVRVERDRHRLADTQAPILLFETGLPTRYYIPDSDVDNSVLSDSDLHTGCPYKGIASYHDVVLDGHRHPSLLWYYEAPFHEVDKIEGYLAPYNERVDVIVDGQLQARPAGPLGRKPEPRKQVA